jgi:selenocysteine lyase/cysteine desulfurase
LINAKPSEISYVPNTSTGENLVINGLGIKRGIDGFGGNVVTDSLHFDGALVHLLELKTQGLDLRIVAPKDFRIDVRDLEKVVDKNTKLIELSLVTMYNGFQHDLKAVCDLALSRMPTVRACTPTSCRPRAPYRSTSRPAASTSAPVRASSG